MKNGASSLPPGLDGAAEQFRLVRLQAFNWGTFDGLVDLAVPRQGYLFVGPSGSGKSTLLDAHAALLTPPKWVDFNVAAREAERHGRDRSLMSYVRGAWAQQTSEDGEHVSQYLRLGTTWSAIAETYQNGRGEVVVLVQVLWVRGSSTAPADVRKLHLVLRREFALRELEFFPTSDFEVRRFKNDLPDAFVRDEFSPYQERFRGLLGIDSERALRLLHKTQSAKNLGDLNVFLRDFMLDPPETFQVAERLVNEFGELHAAHQAVVSAGQQIETLLPARRAHEELERRRAEKSVLDELGRGLDAFCEQARRALLAARIAELGVEAAGAEAQAASRRDVEERERQKLIELQLRRQGLGGGLLEQLQEQLRQSEEEQPKRIQKRDQVSAACRALDWSFPETTAVFAQRVADAHARLLEGSTLADDLERRRDVLKQQQREKEADFAKVCAEVEAMERQRSSIPSHMLAVRARMAGALGITEDALPFAGELLEVKKDAAPWRGAIERVLHGFALSLLVDDRHYGAVSGYLNEHHIGERLVYFRAIPHPETRRSPGPSSLFRKLDMAPGPHAQWLRDELTTHFDYECADTLPQFRNSQRAITREGQVKHSGARHEKDDRGRVDDRRRWVLGFDNKEKLQLFKELAGELAAELSRFASQLEELRDEGERQRARSLHCQTLSNLSWEEIDVAGLLAKIASIHERIARETRARPELAQLDAEIAAQKRAHERAATASNQANSERHGLAEQIRKHERALAALDQQMLSLRLTSTQKNGLEQRFSQGSRARTLESLDSLEKEVLRGLHTEGNALALEMVELRNQIERCFTDFNRQWPAESGGLDATLASVGDYFGKLARLETDGLPRFRERFLQLLHDQSDQNLTLLSHRLDQERGAIRNRLELVNESLLNAEFDPGTHLVIDTVDKLSEEVRRFKQSLREALSHSFRSDEPQLAEQRFLVLSGLVKRFSSQEAADKSWKSLVLDVRQHVEFVAREIDADDQEVEVYGSGVGKSGGQRQKLAATCLAAALRYQLGGQDRALPCFATVVLDEAFDKADAEFTTMAMNIFETIGFQMIVATPLKSVMTLEPFIGGACFVHIKDRKKSSILTIEYDTSARRLLLPDRIGNDEEASLP
ncbi:MAG: SbcC/MukB-like Walker B domain-containing protein [Deltaproteobacteria bacterium]